MLTINKENIKKAQKGDDLRRQTCTADYYDTINIMYTTGYKSSHWKEAEWSKTVIVIFFLQTCSLCAVMFLFLVRFKI